ncbi:MAG: hypothetical protein HGA61_01180 [Candidatus Moranbacteria bacterium]|nr:hypothetical protein [Candidatus Moranbacteria bacterium]
MNLGKTKRIYIFALLISIVLLLASVAYFYTYPNYLANKDLVMTEKGKGINEKDIKSEDEKPGSLIADFESCQKDPESYFRKSNASTAENVFYASFLSLAKKSSSVCDEFGVAKDNNGFSCIEKYLLISALSPDSGSDCSQISNKELSISCSASQKKDQAVCEQIPDLSKRTICQAIASDEKGKCEGLSADQAGSCLNSFILVKALNKKDANLCEQINSSVKGGVYEKAYCKIAVGKNPQNEWNDFYVNEVCLKKFVESVVNEKKDVSLCEKIPDKDADNKSLYAGCLDQFEK